LTARVLVVLAVACLLTAGVAGLASAEITYYYDTIGRLVGVSDPVSDTATLSVRRGRQSAVHAGRGRYQPVRAIHPDGRLLTTTKPRPQDPH
jgi:hypothetical protein